LLGRSSQAHCPADENVWFACTESQYPAFEETDRRIEGDDETRVACEALVRTRCEQGARQVADVRVDGDVD